MKNPFIGLHFVYFPHIEFLMKKYKDRRRPSGCQPEAYFVPNAHTWPYKNQLIAMYPRDV